MHKKKKLLSSLFALTLIATPILSFASTCLHERHCSSMCPEHNNSTKAITTPKATQCPTSRYCYGMCPDHR